MKFWRRQSYYIFIGIISLAHVACSTGGQATKAEGGGGGGGYI